MTYLWARAIRKHRIERSETVEWSGDFIECLSALCSILDIPRPMLLAKHEREWAEFAQTTFLADHFVESIPFDKIEIEHIDPDEKKKRSQDPRNG